MNNALLAGALLIIVGLFALLLAPFFIDWNSYKSQLETYASAYLGADVRVEDELELSFLPRPSLKARNVSIRSFGGDAGGVEMEEMSLRLNLPQLLKRKILIESMVLEAPQLTMVRRQDGSFELPAFLSGLFGDDAAPGQLAAAHVVVEDGRLIFRDERRGAETSLDELNLVLSLDGPQGPLRVEGGGRHGGELYSGRFSAVRDEGPGLRVFFQTEAAAEPFLATLEGRLARPDDGGLAFEGRFSASKTEGEERLYTVSGETTAGFDGATFTNLRIEAGPEGSGFDLAGEGRLTLAPSPVLALDLQSEQIVISAGENGAGEARHPGLAVVRQLLGAVPVPLDLDLAAGTLLVDEVLFDQLALSISIREETWNIERFSIAQRDGASFSARGNLNAAHEAFVFRGDVSLKADSPASLRPLTVRLPQRFAASLRGLRQPVALDATVTASAEALRLVRMTAQLGETRVSGDIWFSGLDARPRLERAKLALNALDLAAFEGPQNFFSSLSDTLSSDNGRIEISASDSRLGEVPLGDLALALARENDVFTLGYLNLTDAEGGKLAASGEVFLEEGALFASLSGRVQTDRLDLITGLLRPVLPAAVSQRLARLARQSKGSDLTLDTSFSLADRQLRDLLVQVDGTLGGTEVAASGNMIFSGEGSEPPRLAISLRNEDGAVLLGQLGSDAAASQRDNAPAAFSLEINGEPALGAEMNLSFNAGETRLSGRGEWNAAAAGKPMFRLAFDHEGPLGPYLAFIGAEPQLAPATARLEGELAYEDGAFRLDGVHGEAAGAPVAADLRLRPGANPVLAGAVKMPRLDAAAALTWAFGEDVFLEEELAQQGMALFTDWPVTLDRFAGLGLDLQLEVDELIGGGRVLARNATGRFKASGGELGLADARAAALGGTVEGNLSLAAPPGGNALLTGRVALLDVALGDMVWGDGGRPLATGRASLSAAFQGSGRTPLTIVSGLGGEGALSLQGISIRRLNPGAFRSIVQASRSVELDEARVREVFAGYLDTGALNVGDIEVPVRIASGMLRLQNVAFERGEERLRFDNALNLATGAVRAEWTIRSEGALVAGGTAPEATIVFSGPVAAPERQIDVSALTGYLAVQALEREVDRIERLQADILEKERFSRELRAQDDQRRRREREAEAVAEEAPTLDQQAPATPPTDDAASAPQPDEVVEETPPPDAPEAAPAPVSEQPEQSVSQQPAPEQPAPQQPAPGQPAPASDLSFPPGFADSLTAPPPGTSAPGTPPVASSGTLLEPVPLPEPQAQPQAQPYEAPAPLTPPAPVPQPQRPANDNPAWVRPDVNGTLR